MIADRKVHGIQLAATMSAGFFDGATLSVYLAYIYQFGLSALWLFVGLALGFLLLRRFAPKIKAVADAHRVYSMPEYFYRVLGKKSGILFSVTLILEFFLLLIVNLIVSGKVLSTIFPLSYSLSVAVGGAIILMYLFLAGFKAVVRTDFFQFLIMITMSVTVALYLFGRTSISTIEWNPVGMGAGNIIGFLVIAALGVMVQPDLWQRLFASRDRETLRRGLAGGAVILPLLAIVISVVGLATKQFFPQIRPEDALVTGFSHLLPFGLKEFGMVLLYAVSLSSTDTVTFVVSSIFTRDLQNYSARYSQKSMRQLTRFFIVLFVVLGVAIAILYQDILALGFSLASLSLALFPAVFGSLYWKLDDRAVAWSLALALLSVAALFLFHALTPATAVVSLPVALVTLCFFQWIWASKRA